jgi:L-amino acid N-acyltransferase YncA
MITVQVEPLMDVLDDLKVLFPAHYEELALDKDKVPLDPDYGIYKNLALQNMILCVTLRENGKIIGYFVGFIKPHLHYRTCLTLTMDIFYVRQDKRAGFNGVKLFRAVEAEARRIGVQRWFMGSKNHKASVALFKRIGAIPVEEYYSKWLGD